MHYDSKRCSCEAPNLASALFWTSGIACWLYRDQGGHEVTHLTVAPYHLLTEFEELRLSPIETFMLTQINDNVFQHSGGIVDQKSLLGTHIQVTRLQAKPIGSP